MKYIVCIPLGGIYDMLLVIDKCLQHAIDYNRILIIETTTSSWFKHNIHDYILFNHPNISFQTLSELYNGIKNLSVYPFELKDKLNCLKTTYTKDGPFIHNVKSNIDLLSDYQEDIIVYSHCGGCGNLNNLLNFMKFKKNVSELYINRINKLKIDYISVHVRNTDRKSDVTQFITNNYNELENATQIFLATDDANSVIVFRKTFPEKIEQFSNIPNSNGKNIHYHHNGIDQTEFILDCIVDVLLLSSGKKFLFSCKESRYAHLALRLFKDKELFNKMICIS